MDITQINISDLKEVNEFKSFYDENQIDDLVDSIRSHGQLRPISVTTGLEIVDGYRVVAALVKLGEAKVYCNCVSEKPILYDRIILNRTRNRTEDDKAKEIIETFKYFESRKGKKSLDGQKYSRYELIENSLNKEWKGSKTLAKLEQVIKNDFDDRIILCGIVGNRIPVDQAYQYVTQTRKIDKDNQYGYTDKFIKGELSLTDVNNLVKSRLSIEHWKPTFVIPGKARSFNIDCIELGKIAELFGVVDLIFTSPPYFKLRKYEAKKKNEEKESTDEAVQLGHEETVEEFSNRTADILDKLYPTLKKSANVMVNIGESYDQGVGMEVVYELKHAIQKRTKLIYKDTLVWSKPNPKPQNETIRRPINNMEFILWFVVDVEKAKYIQITYPKSETKISISKGVKDVDLNGKVWDKNISITKPYAKIRSHISQQEVEKMIVATTGKNWDVYEISPEGHPAIMSAYLPIIPILMTTHEDDTVLDPFSGSNVVGRVTCLLNRRALSAELSTRYYNIGCSLIQKAVKDFHRPSLDIINEMVGISTEESSRIAA